MVKSFNISIITWEAYRNQQKPIRVVVSHCRRSPSPLA